MLCSQRRLEQGDDLPVHVVDGSGEEEHGADGPAHAPQSRADEARLFLLSNLGVSDWIHAPVPDFIPHPPAHPATLVFIICTRFAPICKSVRAQPRRLHPRRVDVPRPASREMRIHAARHVVPRGNRQKRARIVVESHRVVEAGSFRDRFAESLHALRAVVEPPGRAQPQARIMPGQRREFAAVGRIRPA